MPEPTQEDVLARIRAIPAGFVSAYGDVCPAAPRLTGAVLARCDDPEVPWQRVGTEALDELAEPTPPAD